MSHRDLVRKAEGEHLRTLCGDDTAAMYIAKRAIEMTDAFFVAYWHGARPWPTEAETR